jgi:hypothetical protein
VSFAEEEAIDCLLIAMASVPFRLWSGTASGLIRRPTARESQSPETSPPESGHARQGQGEFLRAAAYQRGKTLAERQGDHPSEQQFYAGFVKPREVAHDAALYLM